MGVSTRSAVRSELAHRLSQRRPSPAEPGGADQCGDQDRRKEPFGSHRVQGGRVAHQHAEPDGVCARGHRPGPAGGLAGEQEHEREGDHEVVASPHQDPGPARHQGEHEREGDTGAPASEQATSQHVAADGREREEEGRHEEAGPRPGEAQEELGGPQPGGGALRVEDPDVRVRQEGEGKLVRGDQARGVQGQQAGIEGVSRPDGDGHRDLEDQQAERGGEGEEAGKAQQRTDQGRQPSSARASAPQHGASRDPSGRQQNQGDEEARDEEPERKGRHQVERGPAQEEIEEQAFERLEVTPLPDPARDQEPDGFPDHGRQGGEEQELEEEVGGGRAREHLGRTTRLLLQDRACGTVAFYRQRQPSSSGRMSWMIPQPGSATG